MPNSTRLDSIILAPMEGVLDFYLREILTEINSYDFCISEFLRINHYLHSEKTFLRLFPELKQEGKTKSGTSIRIQLLGSSPEWMAENANLAIKLGSFGIDLNFGCPSKKVIQNEGGANLLKFPEKIYEIVKSVKSAIPKEQILSVKMRLGWDSSEHCFEIAHAIEQAGANELTIHGRTKEDGYKSDKINWPLIGEIRKKSKIPIIANGEIWQKIDAKNCLQSTNCNKIMIGRGALTLPNLSRVIKFNENKIDWKNTLNLIKKYAKINVIDDSGFYHLARIKQWLGYLKTEFVEASILFAKVRSIKNSNELRRIILLEKSE